MLCTGGETLMILIVDGPEYFEARRLRTKSKIHLHEQILAFKREV